MVDELRGSINRPTTFYELHKKKKRIDFINLVRKYKLERMKEKVLQQKQKKIIAKDRPLLDILRIREARRYNIYKYILNKILIRSGFE